MSYTKVVIISSHEFDRRISVLFQTATLRESGANVEYWNVSALTYKEHVTPFREELSQRTISSFKEFECSIIENLGSSTLYIVYMNYDYITYSCYRKLSLYDCDILYCINGVLPDVMTPCRSYNFQTILRGIKNHIAFYKLRTPSIKPAKFELRTCAKAGHAYKTDDNTISIAYNSTDYEDSLHLSDYHVEEPYIVFLDQYLPLHPDNKLAGEQGADVKLYFEQMNHLFDVLEQNHQCRVVIAAHPAAKGYNEGNPFGCQLITGKITGDRRK